MIPIDFNDPTLVDVKITNATNAKLYINSGIAIPPLRVIKLSELRMSVRAFGEALPYSALIGPIAQGDVTLDPIKNEAFTIIDTTPTQAEIPQGRLAALSGPNPFSDEISPDVEIVLAEVPKDDNSFGDETTDITDTTPETEPVKVNKFVQQPGKKR